MRPLSDRTRKILTHDDFMTRCCLCGIGPVQWHHHLIFGGKQVDEPWAILPLCTTHHRVETKFKFELDGIMLSRATDEQLKPYCTIINYIKRKHEQTS